MSTQGIIFHSTVPSSNMVVYFCKIVRQSAHLYDLVEEYADVKKDATLNADACLNRIVNELWQQALQNGVEDILINEVLIKRLIEVSYRHLANEFLELSRHHM